MRRRSKFEPFLWTKVTRSIEWKNDFLRPSVRLSQLARVKSDRSSASAARAPRGPRAGLSAPSPLPRLHSHPPCRALRPRARLSQSRSPLRATTFSRRRLPPPMHRPRPAVHDVRCTRARPPAAFDPPARPPARPSGRLSIVASPAAVRTADSCCSADQRRLHCSRRQRSLRAAPSAIVAGNHGLVISSSDSGDEAKAEAAMALAEAARRWRWPSRTRLPTARLTGRGQWSAAHGECARAAAAAAEARLTGKWMLASTGRGRRAAYCTVLRAFFEKMCALF